MFLSDLTMRLLMELDAPNEQKIALLASMRADESAAAPIDQAKERKRLLDRERIAEKRRVSRDVAECRATLATVADVALPLAPPPSPRTPQPPPRTRECISTRERDAREASAFVRFWAAYPRKVGKADARKAFTRAWRKLPAFDEEAVLVGGLERAKAAWTDAQFIPHAATWLNGERWTDEPDPPAPRAPHERPSRPDNRRDAFVERLGDIDAAMAAAFEQPRERH